MSADPKSVLEAMKEIGKPIRAREIAVAHTG